MFKNISLASLLSVLLLAAASSSFHSEAQKKSLPSIFNIDPYSMSPNSPHKPALQGFLVRLHGDNGVSIIDTDGNVVSRNFIPATNSQGEVSGGSDEGGCTTPVIDGIFCIRRSKEVKENKWESSMTIYSNPANPKPIPGLSNLYSANIINPNLFPICRRGERIKFVDSKGIEKFTVMPIDGKEPYAVHPKIANGLIFVKVEYDVDTHNDKESVSIKNANGRGTLNFRTGRPIKWGAIDTNGKWVIYPEWDYIEPQDDGTFLGWKVDKIYRINSNGKAVRDTRFDNFNCYFWSPTRGKYVCETFRNGNGYDTNVYDLDMNYITTLNSTDDIEVNHKNPNILCVRKGYLSEDDFYCLIDLSKGNKVISKKYFRLRELPDGNYIAHNRISTGYKTDHCLVNMSGEEKPLPEGSFQFPLKKPLMALCYKTNIPYYFITKGNNIPGYLCDFNGNKINNLLIDEYYNDGWKDISVESSYWRIHVYGVDD